MEVFAEEVDPCRSAIGAGGRLEIVKRPVFRSKIASAHPLLDAESRGFHQFHLFDASAGFPHQCVGSARSEQRRRIPGTNARCSGSGIRFADRRPLDLPALAATPLAADSRYWSEGGRCEELGPAHCRVRGGLPAPTVPHRGLSERVVAVVAIRCRFARIGRSLSVESRQSSCKSGPREFIPECPEKTLSPSA